VTANSTWRIVAGVPAALLFAFLFVWLTFRGSPTNTLHASAQAWSAAGLLAIIGTVLGSKALEAMTVTVAPK